ncbi:MAG: 16S rRNA (adenine(1518)-N(6)/adenine(1519)-N(6))-dimethyltransferase RsmA [Fimbriimonadaceae bacterium]
MEPLDPEGWKALLKRRGLWASKGLGQHFLVSQSAIRGILGACAEAAGVLEIGPGPGILTAGLAAPPRTVVAIELDPRLAETLTETAPRAEVLLADALQTDWSEILERLPRPRAIVSNLPYYITAPLLQKTADAAPRIDLAVLMMQREVARRVTAPAGDSERGSLSVHLQGVFRIAKVLDVPPGAFLPPPKVASTVLRLVPREDPMDRRAEPLVRAGFAQPRKTLANNLSAAGGGGGQTGERVLGDAGFPTVVRPHQLSEGQWLALGRALGLL